MSQTFFPQGWIRLLITICALLPLSLGCAPIIIEHPSEQGIYPCRLNENRQFNPAGIEQIIVRTVSSDIQLTAVESQQIDISLTGETDCDQEQNPYVTLLSEVQNDNTLYIEVQHRPGISGNSSNLLLDLLLPEHFSPELTVTTVSGNLQFSALDLNGFTCQSISGSIQGDKLQAENIKLESTSGNACISDINGHLTFDSVSGDIEVGCQVLSHNIRASTTSGQVVFRLPSDASFRLLCETVSGKISTDFPDPISHSSGRRLEQTVNTGENQINIQTISGSICIL